MTFYLVRHKATGEYMPELERGRGYSHWNPAVEPTNKRFRPRKLTGCPRLFSNRNRAIRCIAAWHAFPNSYTGYRQGDGDNDDIDINIKDDNRKKEDLEVVIINIRETGIVKS